MLNAMIANVLTVLTGFPEYTLSTHGAFTPSRSMHFPMQVTFMDYANLESAELSRTSLAWIRGSLAAHQDHWGVGQEKLKIPMPKLYPTPVK